LASVERKVEKELAKSLDLGIVSRFILALEFIFMRERGSRFLDLAGGHLPAFNDSFGV
jgi:hypothetical protein